jgi:hypothetical protein
MDAGIWYRRRIHATVFNDTRPGNREKESAHILQNALEAASKYKEPLRSCMTCLV